MDQDSQHLRLLSIFHYVCAGITALVGCFPLIHLAIGILVAAPIGMDQSHEAPPRIVALLIGGLFIVGAAFMIAMFWILAFTMAMAGRCLARRKRYTFCIVAAAVECMLMPFGTVLGVLTIIVLTRPSVKMKFESAAVQPATA